MNLCSGIRLTPVCASAPTPKFACICCESGCELRVQKEHQHHGRAGAPFSAKFARERAMRSCELRNRDPGGSVCGRRRAGRGGSVEEAGEGGLHGGKKGITRRRGDSAPVVCRYSYRNLEHGLRQPEAGQQPRRFCAHGLRRTIPRDPGYPSGGIGFGLPGDARHARTGWPVNRRHARNLGASVGEACRMPEYGKRRNMKPSARLS